MSAHSVIVTDCGDIVFTEVHASRDRAQESLAQWVCDSWYEDECEPGDFQGFDFIEYFFDHAEDYGHYLGPVNLPKPIDPQEDIYLTPAMCRIVREALGNFNFDFAKIILEEEEEGTVFDLGEAEATIVNLIKEFEV